MVNPVLRLGEANRGVDLLLSSHHSRSMPRCSIRSKEHEEIWKTTQRRAVVGGWAVILSPVL